MATSSSTITSYDWSTNSTQLFSYLQRAAQNDETLESSDQVLASLSEFINPLLSFSNHPLLKNNDFYVCADTLLPKLEKVQSLWTNAIFRGCCMMTDEGDNESSAVTTESTCILNPNVPVYWLDTSRASYVMTLLQGCAENVEVSNTIDTLKKVEVQMCEQIFEEVQAHLPVLNKIFECPIFIQQDFYTIVAKLNPNEKTKIKKLFLAIMDSQDESASSSLRSTPSTTPKASPFRRTPSSTPKRSTSNQKASEEYKGSPALTLKFDDDDKTKDPSSYIVEMPTSTNTEEGKSSSESTPLLNSRRRLERTDRLNPVEDPCCIIL
jgi:hypothetical protein